MLDDGSKLRDVSILADEGAELAVEISVARLARLVHELAAPTGTAVARVQFSRERGFAVAQVQAEARYRVNHGDLTALLYLQGYEKAEFVG